MNPGFAPRHAILLAALAAAYPAIGLGAGAARVDFATHGVNAQAPDGSRRVLSKGSEVLPGDTVITNEGRAQMRFTDGAMVSLKPGSEFRVDEYRYNGKPDREERGFFSLLKGGLRTITGLIGRAERNNYQVRTATATIGIRGTEYSVTYGNSINVNTGEGIVEVCNSAGCLLLYPGDEGYVEADSKPPVLVQTGEERPKKDDAPPELSDIEAPAKDRNANGSVTGLGPSVTPITGTQTYGYAWAATANVGSSVPIASSFVGADSGPGSIDNNGALRSFDSGCCPFDSSSGSVASLGNDGVIAWGRWSGPNLLINNINYTTSILHYTAGLPADPTSLPDATYTYSTIGGSVSRSPDGVSFEFGSINNSSTLSMTVTLGTATVSNLQIDMNVGSTTYNLVGQPGASISAAGSFSASGNLPACSTCSLANVSGQFVGAGASRAGVGFSFNDGQAGAGDVSGVAAFKR